MNPGHHGIDRDDKVATVWRLDQRRIVEQVETSRASDGREVMRDETVLVDRLGHGVRGFIVDRKNKR